MILKDLLIWLYNNFPREIGIDLQDFSFRRIYIEDFKTFLYKINDYSYDFNTYTTIYGGFKGEKEYNTGTVDKIVLDIDNINNWENVKELHYYLLKKEVRHTIIFSGSKGFHIYIFTDKKYDYTYKNSIKNIGLKLKETFNLDVDTKILGDMARLIRIPNSINKKSNLFAIPLTDRHFEMSIDEIKKEAKYPSYLFKIYGRKGVKLKQISNIHTNEINNNYKTIEIENIIFPPFLTNILQKKKEKWERNVGHHERMLIILYLFEAGGWSKEKVDKFMREHLTKEEYEHMQKEKQIDYLFKRFYILKDYNFPSTQTIEGWLGIKLNDKDIEILNKQIYDIRKELLKVV